MSVQRSISNKWFCCHVVMHLANIYSSGRRALKTDKRTSEQIRTTS